MSQIFQFCPICKSHLREEQIAGDTLFVCPTCTNIWFGRKGTGAFNPDFVTDFETFETLDYWYKQQLALLMKFKRWARIGKLTAEQILEFQLRHPEWKENLELRQMVTFAMWYSWTRKRYCTTCGILLPEVRSVRSIRVLFCDEDYKEMRRKHKSERQRERRQERRQSGILYGRRPKPAKPKSLSKQPKPKPWKLLAQVPPPIAYWLVQLSPDERTAFRKYFDGNKAFKDWAKNR